MNEEQFRREKLYQAAMSVAKKLKNKGLISENEYAQIDTKLLEKYQPIFCTLWSSSACYIRRSE